MSSPRTPARRSASFPLAAALPAGVARMPVSHGLAAWLLATGFLSVWAAEPQRQLRFQANSVAEAVRWQEHSRAKLLELMLGGSRPPLVPPEPDWQPSETHLTDQLRIERVTLRTRPDRRVPAWLAVPLARSGRLPGVLALHGHGGSGEQVVRGMGLYWYGRALARAGCVVIAPDMGQHTLQHPGESLMGERTWDALRCLDYLAGRPEVDPDELWVAGLSLGGETAMYVAALDPRVRGTVSSGWLTTIENLKQGHCPCWNFPGLEAHFDFADIFACVAPRKLILEIGQQERAPGGFPVDVARAAFAELQAAWRVWRAETNLELVVHPGGHEFDGSRLWEHLEPRLALRSPGPATPEPAPASPERAWLIDRTAELLEGCRVSAPDGAVFYTPDGRGNYRALWTRDFAYMVEYAGDLLPPEHVEAGLRALIRGIRADGAAPDRVRPDGVAVYVAGPENQPLGEPNLDNGPFLVLAVDAYLQRLAPGRSLPRFREWAPPLQRALEYPPRSPAGLVYNDPERPHSPYGFTDTVGKTGELLFESLLYWAACRRWAPWCERFGQAAWAAELRHRADRIEAGLGRLWDESAGAFLAASRDCRQLDIWGNAFAIWLEFPLGERRARVLEFLARNRDRFLYRGQVRHLLQGEYWKRQLTPVAPERYQNGAYWATASGWVMWALAQHDPALGRQVWTDLVADFRAHGIYECINEGYRQLDRYVVSATNPLAAARRLGY